MTETMLGWHWLRSDGTLAYPPHTRVTPGLVLHATGPLVVCGNGLHASQRALDALKYAPGPIIERVHVTGELIHDRDKSVGRTRTCLWMADATQSLHEFACWCAEWALQAEQRAGREPDARSWAAITTKRHWLRGGTSSQDLAAAEAAAGAAAGAAAEAILNAELEDQLLRLGPTDLP